MKNECKKPSPSMGEGWVGVMPGESKTPKSAPIRCRENNDHLNARRGTIA
jgi:hypothetical protein